MADSKNIIYDNYWTKYLCQEVCTFQYYNLRTKKVNCDNPAQKRVININIDKINFYRNIIADKYYCLIKKV